ncbi:MAG: pyruvate dehydrogenase complex dihydrolipoamide acetyltransferase [Saprospirales bacterium]|nr:MAG: pyruvate dehydrogenase complex dihydrolipoamide acetyltransferase [Saprospirales bacterium]
MAEVLKMPRMSDTMEEGVIVAWHKKVGDKIEPGDILAEVETDKATMDLESYQEGTLLYIGVEKGAVPVDSVIAVIGEEGEDYKEALEAEESSAPEEAEAQTEDASPADSDKGSVEPKKSETPVEDTSQQAAHEDGKRVKVSPLARNMANESGLDLNAIKGSGEGGRIVKRDIEKALEQGVSGSSLAAAASDVAFEEIPVSQMRKTIARRLAESKFTAPHFYLTIEIDMGTAIQARKRINEMIAPDKVSFNDLVIKACAAALKLHPAVNSSWMGDHIRRNRDVNIGVAVAVDEGLLVPVIKNTDQKNLTAINKEVAQFAEKARDKKLQPDEMQGNTFTISNLGMFGIEEFTAIINPPDACILAVGAITEKPVVVNGELAVGNRMRVTLSCDHRVVDGATGAKFLADLKHMLEDPLRMIV